MLDRNGDEDLRECVTRAQFERKFELLQRLGERLRLRELDGNDPCLRGGYVGLLHQGEFDGLHADGSLS